MMLRYIFIAILATSVAAPTALFAQTMEGDIMPPVVTSDSPPAPPADYNPDATSAPVVQEYAQDFGTTEGNCPQCTCHACDPGTKCESCTEKEKKAAKAKAAKAFKGVWYANDFSYLNDPCYEGDLFFDQAKQLNMPRCGKLDIGGQVRGRAHFEKGMKGAQRFLDTEDSFLLTRVRLFGNYQVTDNIRFFAETLYADSTGQKFAPRGIDENSMDIQNFLLDLKLTDDLSLMVGRQELLYGAQRTVSPLDWANTRRTFEGVRAQYKTGDWVIDGFYTAFVPVQPLQMDSADWERPFYGIYSNYNGLDNATVDFYYLGFDNRIGNNQQTLHTLGSRLNGKTSSDLKYDVEGAVQFGRRSGGQGQGEGFITAGVGYQFQNALWKPTVWTYMDYASQNYNQLFPLAHKYLGFIDAVQRTNILSPNVLVTAKPHDKVQLLMWYYYFMSPHQGNALGIGNQFAQNPNNRDLGQELDFTCKLIANPRFNVVLGYSHFWRGSKILNNTDADFVYSQVQMDF